MTTDGGAASEAAREVRGPLRVHEHTRDDIVWPFRGQPFIPLGSHAFRRNVEIDPTPALGHDPGLVKSCLESAAAHAPLLWPVDVHLLPAEDAGRTNGSTFVDPDYSKGYDVRDQRRDVMARISLCAKRIQPHPGVTRYLVAHEYGHVVEDYINTFLRGNTIGMSEVEREYAELRGMSMLNDYGAGRWHVTLCEVLANDFRILVCGVEKEFWPHPGVPRPDNNQALRNWWSDRIVEICEAING